jgi:adenylate kinase family enzyme
MKRIIVFGNSGSGKTWIGQKIVQLLRIPYFGLDSIFWEPDGYNRQRHDSDIETDLAKISMLSEWLTEGVFGHLIDKIISRADTVIYINPPWDECKSNLISRGSESSKQLDPVNAEDNFQALLKWASEYYTRESKASKKYHITLFDNFTGQKYLVNDRNEMNQLLNEIRISFRSN